MCYNNREFLKGRRAEAQRATGTRISAELREPGGEEALGRRYPSEANESSIIKKIPLWGVESYPFIKFEHRQFENGLSVKKVYDIVKKSVKVFHSSNHKGGNRYPFNPLI